MISQIAPAELAAWRADAARAAPVVVDVREPWEYAHCRIEGSVSIPLGRDCPRAWASCLPSASWCSFATTAAAASTRRSGLRSNGFADVHNLRGGVEAWAVEVDPGMRRY